MTLSPEVKKRIESIVQGDAVVLFMKGTRHAPQCGFSATVVQILNGIVDQYTTVNVLSDPDIRQGIKEYSSWPTIPQLYIRGEFIGGCDIVRELHESGELHKKLGSEPAAVKPPAITVTEAARAALQEALKEADEGDFIHLTVSTQFEHSLDLGSKSAADIEVQAGGITFLIDPMSARRASGVVIDFIETEQGAGFKIDNPNAPAQESGPAPRIGQLSPRELKTKLDSGEPVELFDVRSEQERSRARIEKSRLLDEAAQAHLEALDTTTPIVFYCHRGERSQAAAEYFWRKGFRNVYNLAGGIDAWSREVDPKVPRY